MDGGHLSFLDVDVDPKMTGLALTLSLGNDIRLMPSRAKD
jgi:hypothetical protein